MNLLLFIYFLGAAVSVAIEPSVLSMEDLEEKNRIKFTCSFLQAIIHYLRVALVWPLYVVEDKLIKIYNNQLCED